MHSTERYLKLDPMAHQQDGSFSIPLLKEVCTQRTLLELERKILSKYMTVWPGRYVSSLLGLEKVTFMKKSNTIHWVT